jgi:hypothetical protein
MREAFGFAKPIDREVSLVYKGEKSSAGDPSKLVVEMEKERPAFFSRNLVQESILWSHISAEIFWHNFYARIKDNILI